MRFKLYFTTTFATLITATAIYAATLPENQIDSQPANPLQIAPLADATPSNPTPMQGLSQPMQSNTADNNMNSNDGVTVSPYPPTSTNAVPPDTTTTTNAPSDAPTPDTATGDDDY